MHIFEFIKERIFRFKYARATMPQKMAMIRPRFYHLGENVQLYTNSFGTEPYLICIEDNVCVAADVKFITHDISCFNMARFLNINREQVDKVGSIILKENCFVGAYSILMPNCSVGRNSVIAAGSVVTKHVPDNEVWGGNPARFIMSTEEYAKRVVEKSGNWEWTGLKDSLPKEDLVAKRQQYFFKVFSD